MTDPAEVLLAQVRALLDPPPRRVPPWVPVLAGVALGMALFAAGVVTGMRLP